MIDATISRKVNAIEALCCLASANVGDDVMVRLSVTGSNSASLPVRWDIIKALCVGWKLYMEDRYAFPGNTEGMIPQEQDVNDNC